MELQTKFLFVKMKTGEDLIGLGVFPSNPDDISTFDFDHLVYLLFPTKVYYAESSRGKPPTAFRLAKWSPLSKAELYRIPFNHIINVDTPIEEAIDEYTLFLVENMIDADKIKAVLTEHLEGESPVETAEKPTTLH